MFPSKGGWESLSHVLSPGTLAYVVKKGYEEPTAIQAATLPRSRIGKNVAVESPTGSGKTFAYLVPVVEGLTDYIKHDLDTTTNKMAAQKASIAAGYSISSDEEEIDSDVEIKLEEAEEVTSGPGAVFKVGGVIILPTHELAVQVHQELVAYLEEYQEHSEFGKFVRPFFCSTVESFEQTAQRVLTQRSNLARNIVIGTPSRLEKLFDPNVSFLDTFTIKFNTNRYVVFDEADRMLNNKDEMIRVRLILDRLPKREKHTFLFSATLPHDPDLITRNASCIDPVFIRLTATQKSVTVANKDNAVSLPKNLDLRYIDLHETQKVTFMLHLLKHLYEQNKGHKILIFCLSKAIASWLTDVMKLFIHTEKFLGEEMSSAQNVFIGRMFGKMDKHTREREYNKFINKAPEDPERRPKESDAAFQLRKENQAKYYGASFGIMICTDLLERGIDFDQKVSFVISNEAPNKANTMVHRAGRTARADKAGTHLMMLSPREKDLFLNYCNLKGMKPGVFSKCPMIDYDKFRHQKSIMALKHFGKFSDNAKIDKDVRKKLRSEVFVVPDEQNLMTEISRYHTETSMRTDQGADIKHHEQLLDKLKADHFFLGTIKDGGFRRTHLDCRDTIGLFRYLSINRREFFKGGEECFITHLKAYSEHELSTVFPMYKGESMFGDVSRNKMNLAIPRGLLGCSFGLLKMPRIKEVRGTPFTHDFVQHKMDDYLSIEYSDPVKNQDFLNKREFESQKIADIRAHHAKQKAKTDKLNTALDNGYLIPNRKANEVRKRKRIQVENEEDELRQDKMMSRKVKRGKATQAEADKQLVNSFTKDAAKKKISNPRL